MSLSLAWPLCKDDTQIHEAHHEKRKESRKREINVSPPASPSNLNPVWINLNKDSLGRISVFLFVCLFATPHSMWDLSSLSWGWTYAPCLGSMGRTLLVSLESPVFQLQKFPEALPDYLGLQFEEKRTVWVQRCLEAGRLEKIREDCLFTHVSMKGH